MIFNVPGNTYWSEKIHRPSSVINSVFQNKKIENIFISFCWPRHWHNSWARNVFLKSELLPFFIHIFCLLAYVRESASYLCMPISLTWHNFYGRMEGWIQLSCCCLRNVTMCTFPSVQHETIYFLRITIVIVNRFTSVAELQVWLIIWLNRRQVYLRCVWEGFLCRYAYMCVPSLVSTTGEKAAVVSWCCKCLTILVRYFL